MERCESERKRSFIRCETLCGCSGYVIEEKGKSSPSPHSLEKERENFFGSLDFKLSLSLSLYNVYDDVLPGSLETSLAVCIACFMPGPFLLFLFFFFFFFLF